jgi:hypothetical protein
MLQYRKQTGLRPKGQVVALWGVGGCRLWANDGPTGERRLTRRTLINPASELLSFAKTPRRLGVFHVTRRLCMLFIAKALLILARDTIANMHQCHFVQPICIAALR